MFLHSHEPKAGKGPNLKPQYSVAVHPAAVPTLGNPPHIFHGLVGPHGCSGGGVNGPLKTFPGTLSIGESNSTTPTTAKSTNPTMIDLRFSAIVELMYTNPAID
jgi:hypothetical protein